MSRENVYHGQRTRFGRTVTVNGRPLDEAFRLRRHSPDGFEWGYHGSGPAQLALAILANEYGDAVAQEFYIEFKSLVVARLPRDEWTLTSRTLDAVMQELGAQVEISRGRDARVVAVAPWGDTYTAADAENGRVPSEVTWVP